MRTITKIILTIALCLFSSNRNVLAIGQQRIVDSAFSKGSFRLVQKDETAVLYVDLQDYAGVVRLANDLQVDIASIASLIKLLIFTEMLASLPPRAK